MQLKKFTIGTPLYQMMGDTDEKRGQVARASVFKSTLDVDICFREQQQKFAPDASSMVCKC